MVTELAVKPAQTFLVGDVVYLRPLTKDDAKRVVLVRNTPYPVSPERVEAWITEDLVKGDSTKNFTYAIVRIDDDVVVGSIQFEWQGYLRFAVTAWVAPILGARGLHWKAEAIALAGDWLANEIQIPTVLVHLPVTEQIVIDRLLASDFVITTRLREKLLMDGVRVDSVTLQRFNADWVETLGDPMAIELPRSGSGIARPPASKPGSVESTPKNAVLVGPRVYLRPTTRADLEQTILWSRRETDTFHISGRRLPSLGEFIKDVDSDESEEFPHYIFFSVCERETDLYFGEVGLMHVDYINRTAESASWLQRPEFRAQGFGSEAKHLLLEYTFNTLGFHMVESCVRFENTRSAAALRKQGYREAGRIGWMSNRDGAFSNFVTFDLLADEWRALSSLPG